MADTILREEANMAANQPLSENRTVAFKDKVIDSQIMKKAKRQTISLADIIQSTAQRDDDIDEPVQPRIVTPGEQKDTPQWRHEEPPAQQYPTNQQYPSYYPRPPA